MASNQTLLLIAVVEGREAVVNVLLEHEADPELTLADNVTQLIESIIDGQDNADCAALEYGVILTCRTELESFLLEATGVGAPRLAKRLLGKGVDVNLKKNEWQSLLIESIRETHYSYRKMLHSNYQAVIDSLLD
ncbi:hypothetical protein BGW36DRAFT_354731 [Talaromyces proteolyticus]|uniref:Ankyrin repeat protein n=1 Tax=Talaromyces proteolyticus TaxID=1131652 RepID=A0AAD4KZ59_9EURO|nr:uncharacterized protein BGW36DRAFT_354731 [Talaromyces proteolyticus]KAH8703304.1 hypothetical protein BGW36DRAFT_354731 [Talaromyces proteolyticus]